MLVGESEEAGSAVQNYASLQDSQSPEVREVPHRCQVLLQRHRRTVFQGHGATETIRLVIDRFEDVAVVDCTGTRLVASGNITDVKMPDAVDVGPDTLDQIPLHDLDVIDIKQQLDVRAADTIDQLGA